MATAIAQRLLQTVTHPGDDVAVGEAVREADATLAAANTILTVN